MKPKEFIKYCRATRRGVPEGDVLDPHVLADLLTMILTERLEELEGRACGPSGGVQDSRTGRVVPNAPGVSAPDPRVDSLAVHLATLLTYVQDAGRR